MGDLKEMESQQSCLVRPNKYSSSQGCSYLSRKWKTFSVNRLISGNAIRGVLSVVWCGFGSYLALHHMVQFGGKCLLVNSTK